MIRPYIALCLAVAVSSFPQSGNNLCGSDENGVTRVAGDTWQEDCNRCKCTDNLLPGCTKRFCGVFPSQPPKSTGSSSSSQQRKTASLRENKCGSDERGVARVAGDTWQEDCNRCKCTEELLPGCTKRFCGVFPPPPSPSPTSSPTSKPTSSAPRVGGGGIMFPGDSRAEQTTLTTLSCTDSSGERREVGESWAEECNTCRCGNKGIALCTHRFCINVEEFKKEKSLFTVDQTKNAEEIIQCRAEGAKNCRAVKLNSESRSLLATDSQLLKLLPGSEVELQVVRGPADLSSDTLSYVFKLTDGGEGTLTLRQSTSTAYGSFKPITGSVHYTVEACAGDGCNVIYERDSNFFNNFED